METDASVEITYLLERSILSTDVIPQAWHIDTQLELHAVLNASLGPTSTMAELLLDGAVRNDFSLMFFGSKVSVNSHSNLLCSSTDKDLPVATPTLKHDSVWMLTIEGMVSLVSCRTFPSDWAPGILKMWIISTKMGCR